MPTAAIATVMRAAKYAPLRTVSPRSRCLVKRRGITRLRRRKTCAMNAPVLLRTFSNRTLFESDRFTPR
jgi:hypothetical protein